MRSKVQFYDIVLESRLAMMAKEYCILNEHANGNFWNPKNKLSRIQQAEKMWIELINKTDDLYPEFATKSKTFSIISTRVIPLVIMKVSKS